MKVKEVRQLPGGGFAGYRREVRVRTLDQDETPPVDAETVPDTTPESDWHEETEE